MDENLTAEIESILRTEDLNQQRNSAHKIAVYLLTLPVPSAEHLKLLERFVDKILEILPSSSLPHQLAAKLGMERKRARVVSFSEAQVHIMEDTSMQSAEGRAQEQREAKGLSLQNTDTQRKFVPRQLFTDGLPYNTKKLSRIPSDLKNRVSMAATGVAVRLSRPNVSVESILKDPSALRRLYGSQ